VTARSGDVLSTRQHSIVGHTTEEEKEEEEEGHILTRLQTIAKVMGLSAIACEQGSFRVGTHRNAVPVLFFDHRNAVPVLFGI